VSSRQPLDVLGSQAPQIGIVIHRNGS
jgi:hypothetical protein